MWFFLRRRLNIVMEARMAPNMPVAMSVFELGRVVM
jgi:hypothetical protein